MSDHSSPPCSYLHLLWLNNSAARRIENGEYERAKSFLLKALELNPAANSSRNSTMDENRENKEQRSSPLQVSKPNDYCTLDDCILYSERARSTSSTSTTKNQSLSYEHGSIYCQPIQVGNEDANIGETLLFIIIFNLALAHHLEARRRAAQTNECQTIAEKARLLYELAHNGYMNHCCGDGKQEDSTTDYDDVSIRFIIIIQTNLCQLFRLVDNHQVYELYRQHLVSTVMAVI